MLKYLSGAPLTKEQELIATEAFRKYEDWRSLPLVGIAYGSTAAKEKR